jgi:hypothetical protein
MGVNAVQPLSGGTAETQLTRSNLKKGLRNRRALATRRRAASDALVTAPRDPLCQRSSCAKRCSQATNIGFLDSGTTFARE